MTSSSQHMFVLLFLQKLRWGDSAPASFQSFKNSMHIFSGWMYDKIHTIQNGVMIEGPHKNYAPRAWGILHPAASGSTDCFLMEFTNLAQPDWISIPCNKQLLSEIVCQGGKSFTQTSLNLVHDSQNHFCEFNQMLKNLTCFSVSWVDTKHVAQGIQNFDFTVTQIENVKDFLHYFSFFLEATSHPISPFVFANQSVTKESYEVSFSRIHKIYAKIEVGKQHRSGFVITKSGSKTVQVWDNVFACSNDVFVSQMFLCDGIADCRSNKSDEMCCGCPAENRETVLCQQAVQTSEVTTCGFLHTQTLNGTCTKYKSTDDIAKAETKAELNLSITKFNCDEQEKIDISLVDDLFVDCLSFPIGADETQLMQIVEFGTTFSCHNDNQIPCKEGHSKCYHVFQICIFSLDRSNHLYPCRNGGHLDSCRDFECNAMFKCSQHYCVPWHYICNGRIDCPEGLDENKLCHTDDRCINMFQCRDAEICLHLTNVCDGSPDCPLKDDELLCQLQNVVCPSSCFCVALGVFCPKARHMFYLPKYPYIFAWILGKEIESVSVLKNFEDVQILGLRNSSIQEICSEIMFEKLEVLVFTFNLVTKITNLCFPCSVHLRNIDLSFNIIHTIEVESFTNLPRLNFLNISNNNLISFQGFVFSAQTDLRILSFYSHKFVQLNVSGLQSFRVRTLETLDYSICCFVSVDVACSAAKPWFLSCTNLLPRNSIQICFLCTGVILLIFCLFSLLLHSKSSGGKKGSQSNHNVVVVTISATDCLFVAYVLALWAASQFFQGQFIAFEKAWKSHWVCFLMQSISSAFYLVSPVLVLYLSLLRFLVVKYPMKIKFKRKKFCFTCVVWIFVVGTLSSQFPVITTFIVHKSLPNHLCFPFYDPSQSFVIAKIQTLVFVSFQLLTLFSELFLHSLLAIKLSTSRKTIGKHSTKQESSSAVHGQLAVLSISHVVCCFGKNSVYLLSHILHRCPVVVILWTISVVESSQICATSCVFSGTALRKIIKKKPRLWLPVNVSTLTRKWN